MILAINAWAFDARSSLHERAKAAKAAGFDGIELNLEEGNTILRRNSTGKTLNELKRQVNDEGIRITSLCSELHWKYSLVSNNKSEREEAFRIGEELIMCTAVLGGDTALIIPGIVSAPSALRESRETVPYNIAWERSKEAMTRLGNLAQQHGVRVGVENVFFNRFLLSPFEIRRFLSEVRHSHVGFYFDIGNANLCGVPADWLLQLSDVIVGVHVKDSIQTEVTLNTFRPVFLGDTDWVAVRRSLVDTKYSGPLVVEQSFMSHCAVDMIHFLGKSLRRFFFEQAQSS